MANNNDFSILLKSVLDKSGINTELKQIQEIVNKHSIDIIPSLKSASLRNQMKEVSKSIANDFNKTFGTNLTGNDVYKAYLNQVKQVTKEQERLNALQKKNSLSEQQRYYQKIIENNKTIYSLKNKLLSADEKQTLEINKQLKALEQRNVYNRSQLDKKGLTDNSWERIMNNSKIALENQYKINQAKIQDIENTRTISNIQKQAIEIQRSIGNGTYNTQISQLQAQFKNFGLTQTEVTQKMTAIKTAYQNLTTTGISSEELVKRQQLFNNELLKTSNHLKVLKIEMKDYANSASQFKLSTQIENWLTKNTAATKAAKVELSSYIKELNSGQITAKRFDEISMAFTRIDTNMRSMGKLGKSFTQTFVEGMKKFSYWTSSTFLLMKAFHEIKQAVNFAIELDKALTNINYTMDVTSNQLKDIGQSSINIGKDLKTSASNVLGAVILYANAKETADSILKKANPAIMMSNVTGFSGEQSAKYLQTIMNQFDMEQDELMSISDIIQNISQNLAHDFSDGIIQINEGISTSGEVARAAGMDLSDYASMIGILIEKTGLQGSQLGNSLKTIITRTTKAGSIMGIDEGEISKAEESLRKVGIEVRKSDDEFNDFKDTLGELAQKWDTLSQVEKSNISFNLAGTRQINIIQSLLRNWDEYMALVENANNASGTTIQNQEKYANSLEGKLNELKSIGQSIDINLFKNEDLKFLVTGLTKVGEVLDFLTNKLGLFGTTMATLGIIGGIKNVGRTKVSVLI